MIRLAMGASMADPPVCRLVHEMGLFGVVFLVARARRGL
jgi:hypothetical protein